MENVPINLPNLGADLVLSGIFLTILWRVFNYFKEVTEKQRLQIEEKDKQINAIAEKVLTSFNKNTEITTRVNENLKQNNKLISTLSEQLYDVLKDSARNRT